MKHNRILPFAFAALIVATACTKDDSATGDTTTPAAATTVADTAGMDVGDIDMGRHIGPDMKISDKTDDFAPTDTIYASVHTKGGSAPVQLMARWTAEDGTVINEETKTIAAGADTDTEFHVVKAGGWTKGKYTLRLLVDGKEVKSKDVTVK